MDVTRPMIHDAFLASDLSDSGIGFGRLRKTLEADLNSEDPSRRRAAATQLESLRDQMKGGDFSGFSPEVAAGLSLIGFKLDSEADARAFRERVGGIKDLQEVQLDAVERWVSIVQDLERLILQSVNMSKMWQHESERSLARAHMELQSAKNDEQQQAAELVVLAAEQELARAHRVLQIEVGKRTLEATGPLTEEKVRGNIEDEQRRLQEEQIRRDEEAAAVRLAQKAVERNAKLNDLRAWKDHVSARHEVIKQNPYIKAAKVAAVGLVIVSNLVADQAEYANAFLVGNVNAAWDAVYMPIRDGLIGLAQALWPGP